MQFSNDGKRLFAGGSNGNVLVWDAEGGQFLHTMTGHSGSIRSLAVSPDGQRLASGSDDKTIDIWSAN